jgi:drug/metabolite transporter (DMT)-like permease
LVVIAWVYVLALWSIPLLMLGAAPLPAAISPRSWASLGFILLFPTAIGYLLNTYALSRIQASTTAVYVYSQPLITGLAGFWLMGERLSAALLWAGLMLFGGIWLVAKRPKAVRQAYS